MSRPWPVMHNLINTMAITWRVLPEPQRGLTKVQARHQRENFYIRRCHSHCGLWHSAASPPVGCCILVSKMLWVRVTLHRWYGTENHHQSQSCLNKRRSRLALGVTMFTRKQWCHISYLEGVEGTEVGGWGGGEWGIYRMTDVASSSKRPFLFQLWQPENLSYFTSHQGAALMLVST